MLGWAYSLRTTSRNTREHQLDPFIHFSALCRLLAQVSKIDLLFPELVSLNLHRLLGRVLPLTGRREYTNTELQGWSNSPRYR